MHESVCVMCVWVNATRSILRTQNPQDGGTIYTPHHVLVRPLEPFVGELPGGVLDTWEIR